MSNGGSKEISIHERNFGMTEHVVVDVFS